MTTWTAVSGFGTSFAVGLLAFAFGPEVALSACIGLLMAGATTLIVLDEWDNR